MTTIKDMVADTRRMAYGSMSEQMNLVATNAAAGATEISMQLDVTGITPGMVLSSGLNVWYVRGTDAGSGIVYVIPGYDNSPERAVTANDWVYIKPRVTDWYMFESLNQEILRLSTPEHGLYQLKSWTAQVDPTWQTYDFPPEAESMISMLRVRFRMPGTTDVWYDLQERAYKVQINDGQSRIRLLRNIPSGTDISFYYKSPFNQAENLEDVATEVCGLSQTMVDIPTLGVLATLLRTTESRRGQVQTQGDARRADEVSAGSNLSIAARIEKDHQMRIWEEYARLTNRNPLVRGF